ncbi:universal stress protein [Roseovarius faecimaris]|uniref:Universal stress protein n=1 Tax=Roseovarius faecimaris TaxID=2494550 RepID=A0A6I6IX39_9RHOB|nr:universal stress protein [Roseovarius faecimaris]QGX99987.1 universal stress protein [Roseovarius faecimaris]
MYKNILVPVEFDEAHDAKESFDMAQALSEEGAHITVLHVMEPVPAFAMAQIPPEVFANTRKEIETHMQALAEAFPKAATVLVSGHAGRAIVDYASEHDIDCIVIASHRPGLENYFLGSTADRVVRHAKCAVHVMR